MIPLQERDEFVAFLAMSPGGRKLSPSVVANIARIMMRLASQEQRWQEAYCSAELDDAANAKGLAQSKLRDAKMTNMASHFGLPLASQGDPRGAMYRVGDFAVPCQGYTQRELERLCAYWRRRQDAIDKAKAQEVRP